MKKDETNIFDSCPCFDEFEKDKSSIKRGMMKCMKGARWFLIIPGVFVIIAFLLGYFLDPATLRLLWLIITGALLVIGTTFLIAMNFWTKGISKKSGFCCS
jgi:hypothetical protein